MQELFQDAQPKQDNDSIPRRTFLSYAYVVAAISSFMGIILGVPILGYLTSPLLAKQQRGEWIRLGKTTSFIDTPNPRAVQFTLIRQDGWIEVKKAATCWVVSKGDQFTVFNGRCTHLGCAYGWQTHDKYGNVFHCPCHDGVFNPEGEVIGGPPPRPLDRLETKVENGELFALYQDFRLGVSEKDPL